MHVSQGPKMLGSKIGVCAAKDCGRGILSGQNMLVMTDPETDEVTQRFHLACYDYERKYGPTARAGCTHCNPTLAAEAANRNLRNYPQK